MSRNHKLIIGQRVEIKCCKKFEDSKVFSLSVYFLGIWIVDYAWFKKDIYRYINVVDVLWCYKLSTNFSNLVYNSICFMIYFFIFRSILVKQWYEILYLAPFWIRWTISWDAILKSFSFKYNVGILQTFWNIFCPLNTSVTKNSHKNASHHWNGFVHWVSNDIILHSVIRCNDAPWK